jgi:CheY-like chemotaxis protein
MPGLELIQRIKEEAESEVPIIVYTGRELTEEEETQLKRVTESIIIKNARSPEHLLDETTLFLHRVESNLPEPKQKMLKQVQLEDPVLAGRKVLIVDDDARNIFAIASVLERHKMQVVFAENGKKGIEVLHSTPDVDVVLMDVMMPEMDGYETTRALRELPQFKTLPIIALTAKAMKGDREKCIDAGASDYITKPVATDRLLSLLRVWMFKRASAARAGDVAR